MSDKTPKALPGILKGRCPKCGKGKIFSSKGGFVRAPVMHERCAVCGYKFDREPGYFLGAMYVSYAMAVGEGLVAFLLCWNLFPNWPLIVYPIVVTAVILLFTYVNYRFSRVIWLYLFSW